jgi:hypothetical protein
MTIARLSGYEEMSVMHDGIEGLGSAARHAAAATVSRRVARQVAASERAGTPWQRAAQPQRVRHLDVPALVGAGVPLTLLMDLAEPSGPDSSAIYWGEPTVGPETWIQRAG